MNVEFFMQNVKACCKMKGVSPSRACIESGAGKTLMDNVKRGRIPSVDRVQLLAAYLGVSTSELLGEQPPDTPSFDLQLAKAYRQADPGTRAAVRKLLDVEDGDLTGGRG